MTKTLVSLLIVSFLSFCSWGTYRTVKGINFQQDCGGYLERAANANTVELAQKEMARAISYLNLYERKNGYTSIFWKTPDEDVGFWYSNLSESLKELESISPDASSLEKSNVLIKLRETLMADKGKSGVSVIVPEGISIYGSNTGFFWWGMTSLSVLLAAIGVLFYREG